MKKHKTDTPEQIARQMKMHAPSVVGVTRIMCHLQVEQEDENLNRAKQRTMKALLACLIFSV